MFVTVYGLIGVLTAVAALWCSVRSGREPVSDWARAIGLVLIVVVWPLVWVQVVLAMGRAGR